MTWVILLCFVSGKVISQRMQSAKHPWVLGVFFQCYRQNSNFSFKFCRLSKKKTTFPQKIKEKVKWRGRYLLFVCACVCRTHTQIKPHFCFRQFPAVYTFTATVQYINIFTDLRKLKSVQFVFCAWQKIHLKTVTEQGQTEASWNQISSSCRKKLETRHRLRWQSDRHLAQFRAILFTN